MADPRVIIVGAGPAGVRAAETLLMAGIRPTVIDESTQAGGQIYRRQPSNFTRGYAAVYGTEAAKARLLHETFDVLKSRIVYLPETLAWNVFDGALHVLKGTTASAFPFDALIIAAGAIDRLMPIAGWTLPGVYSLGAAQIALKAQACAIGRSVVFMGTGPLLYLVACQYAKAGANVVAVLDTSAIASQLKAMPKLAARPANLIKGLSFLAYLRGQKIAIHRGIVPLAIEGDQDEGVRAVVARTHDGERLVVACEAIGIGYHLRPETQLADLAGCKFRFEPATRQWLPEVDVDGRTSVHGVYLAGDGARLLGADGAELAGRLAAHAVLADFGHSVPTAALARLRRKHARMERFRLGLAEAFPWPSQTAATLPDETPICRCEAITAAELRRVVREMGAEEINRAKAFSRIGMGRCQGRYCGHAAAEVVANVTGLPIEAVGRLRGQAPVKPFPIAATEQGL